jgi:hypothetical protein
MLSLETQYPSVAALIKLTDPSIPSQTDSQRAASLCRKYGFVPPETFGVFAAVHRLDFSSETSGSQTSSLLKNG